MARHLLDGTAVADRAAAFRTPLYPLFLAGVYRLFGTDPLVPRLAQMTLGLGLVAICWRMALHTHGSRVAALTALLAGTYGMFIYFEGEVLGAALITFLAAGATLLLLEGDARGSLSRLALGGVALGLAAVTHALAVVLAPVAVVWASRRGRALGAAAAVLVGAALPIGIVVARNAAAPDGLVGIASQGGINFYIGNHAGADGKSALAPGFPEPESALDHGEYQDNVAVAARTLAERDLGRELTANEIDRYWYARGLQWWADHPKDALVLTARKLIFFWNGWEIANNRDLRDQARRFTPILGFFLGQLTVLLPFALFGLFRTGVRGRPRTLLAGFLAAWTVGVCAFFVCSRFRVPSIPWLLPFAAAGVFAFAGDLRRSRLSPGRLGRSAALLVGAFVATNGLLMTRSGLADVLSERDAPFHRFNLALLFEREGNLDRAIREYRAAAATGIEDPRVHLNLGNLLARTGRLAEARTEYRRVASIAPEWEASARTNLGIVDAQEGDWEGAIRQFDKALARDPSRATALRGLAGACLAAGRFDEAVVAHRRALAAHAGPESELRRGLGAAYLELGLLEDAERESLAALALDPRDVVATVTLVQVYRRRGETEAAERMAARAREIAPGAPAVEEAVQGALTAPD